MSLNILNHLESGREVGVSSKCLFYCTFTKVMGLRHDLAPFSTARQFLPMTVAEQQLVVYSFIQLTENSKQGNLW